MNNIDPTSAPSIQDHLQSKRIFKYTLLESLNIGVCLVNSSERILSLNREGSRILGRSELSCLGQRIHTLIECRVPEANSDSIGCPVSEVLNTGRTICIPQASLRQSNGETCWVEYQCLSISDPSHPGALLLFRDLRQQRQYDDDPQQYASLSHQSPNPIVELDSDAHILYANLSFIQALNQFGINDHGLPNVLPSTILPMIKQSSKTLSTIQETYMVDNDTYYEWTFVPNVETGHLRGYGTNVSKFVNRSFTSGKLPGPISFIDKALRSESHEKRNEEIRKKHPLHTTLNSLTSLAGGIAQDFNKLLMTILGNLFVAKLRAEGSEPIGHALDEAEQACIHAKNLTQQLLTYAGSSAPDKKPLAIGELIRKHTILTLSGAPIGCEFHLPDDLWQVNADEDHMKCVIYHVVMNARQAMPQGGLLTVRGENIVVGQADSIQTSSLVPGRYIKISIDDQGCGIKPSHLSKIFSPYFTTKPKASGLGLATSYAILYQHAGHLDIQSTTEVGTTVSIYLPRLSADSSLPLPRLSTNSIAGNS